ncbi:hypothetical protein [Streptomyces sp. NPDC005385]|uniref:hypothetical protein n=1 Tax=Streptomyces sp. NPDC005385 TaxID=3157039 RepID=UPI0033BA6F43
MIALLCAVAPAAACTSATGMPAARKKTEAKTKPIASAPSCASGTVRWASVHRQKQLTEVSPVVNVRRSDGWVTYYPRLVRNIVPQVTKSDDGVSAQQVLAALATHLGVEQVAALGEDSADRRAYPIQGRCPRAWWAL